MWLVVESMYSIDITKGGDAQMCVQIVLVCTYNQKGKCTQFSKGPYSSTFLYTNHKNMWTAWNED